MQASWRLIGAISISSLILFLPQSNTAADQPDVTESDPISGAPPPPPVAADAANYTAITNGPISISNCCQQRRSRIWRGDLRSTCWLWHSVCRRQIRRGVEGGLRGATAYQLQQLMWPSSGLRRGSIVHGDPELGGVAKLPFGSSKPTSSTALTAWLIATRRGTCGASFATAGLCHEFLRGHARVPQHTMTDITRCCRQTRLRGGRATTRSRPPRASSAASGFAAQSSSAVKAAAACAPCVNPKGCPARCSAQGIQAGWTGQLCSTRTL